MESTTSILDLAEALHSAAVERGWHVLHLNDCVVAASAYCGAVGAGGAWEDVLTVLKCIHSDSSEIHRLLTESSDSSEEGGK